MLLSVGPVVYGSFAQAVSDDGTTVVGYGFIENLQNGAFRWTASGGAERLWFDWSYAWGVSADGSVVVGQLGNTVPGGSARAWRWAPTGDRSLGVLPGGTQSGASDVSADGSVVVGWSSGSPLGSARAFRWTPAAGMVALGALPSGAIATGAAAVSADGAVVVGNTSTGEPFRWTPAGMEGLGFLGIARDLSPDGSMVVGYGPLSSAFDEAFLWSSAAGLLPLGSLPGTESSQAHGVSDTGTVVGVVSRGGPDQAFIWDETHGMRLLADVLANDYGLDLAGWDLQRALGISADGRVIVGEGYSPNGGWDEGWVAIIPEPSTFLLVALGLAGIARKQIHFSGAHGTVR